jgi:hypothetical protein
MRRNPPEDKGAAQVRKPQHEAQRCFLIFDLTAGLRATCASLSSTTCLLPPTPTSQPHSNRCSALCKRLLRWLQLNLPGTRKTPQAHLAKAIAAKRILACASKRHTAYSHFSRAPSFDPEAATPFSSLATRDRHAPRCSVTTAKVREHTSPSTRVSAIVTTGMCRGSASRLVARHQHAAFSPAFAGSINPATRISPSPAALPLLSLSPAALPFFVAVRQHPAHVAITTAVAQPTCRAAAQ